MKGRWAAGIVPRNFAWIVKDRLAVSERPGGYAPHHRPVRRQEEILWLSAQGFTRVISLLPSSHNLRAYEELNLPYAHFPLPANDDAREVLALLYPSILGWLRKGDRLLVHQEELGERVSGVMAGFLYWSGMMAEPPQAISVIENLLRRQLGSAGRSIVAQSIDLPPAVDEYGVPLPRRAVAVESTLLGVPSAAKKLAVKPQPSPKQASSPPPKSTNEKIGDAAKAPRPTNKVAAIRPITKDTKVQSPPLTGAKVGTSEPARKRSTPSVSTAEEVGQEDHH